MSHQPKPTDTVDLYLAKGQRGKISSIPIPFPWPQHWLLIVVPSSSSSNSQTATYHHTTTHHDCHYIHLTTPNQPHPLDTTTTTTNRTISTATKLATLPASALPRLQQIAASVPPRRCQEYVVSVLDELERGGIVTRGAAAEQRRCIEPSIYRRLVLEEGNDIVDANRSLEGLGLVVEDEGLGGDDLGFDRCFV